VLFVGKGEIRFVEKHLLAFAGRDKVTFPILVAISVVGPNQMKGWFGILFFKLAKSRILSRN